MLVPRRPLSNPKEQTFEGVSPCFLTSVSGPGTGFEGFSTLMVFIMYLFM